MNAGQVAAGVTGGCLLGRFRKMRWAPTVAVAVARRRRSGAGSPGGRPGPNGEGR